MNFLALVLLSLAAYRITHFAIYDTLTGSNPETGTWWSKKVDKFAYNEDGSDRNWVRGKIGDLLTCPFCMSFWISGVLYGLWTWSVPWTVEDPQKWIVTVFGVTAFTCLWYQGVQLVERYLDQRDDEHSYTVQRDANRDARR